MSSKTFDDRGDAESFIGSGVESDLESDVDEPYLKESDVEDSASDNEGDDDESVVGGDDVGDVSDDDDSDIDGDIDDVDDTDTQQTAPFKPKSTRIDEIEDELSDDEDGNAVYDNAYLKKVNGMMRNNIIEKYHAEHKQVNYTDVLALSNVVRDALGNIVDPLHTTVPFLTRYEKARIIGMRAKQLASGSEPFVTITPEEGLDNIIVAEKELTAKKLPFIIVRPIPGGKKEFWKVSDLEQLDY